MIKRFLSPLLWPQSAPAETCPEAARTVPDAIAATQRELAIFASEQMGAQFHFGQFDTRRDVKLTRSLFRDRMENSAEPCIVIDPRPGLHIVTISDSYAAATMIDPFRAAGQKLFDTFPDNPDLPEADGVSNLFLSIQRAAQSGRPQRMPIQRYDVRDPQGRFVEMRWQCTNIPVLDEDGQLAFVVHQAVQLRDGNARRIA